MLFLMFVSFDLLLSCIVTAFYLAIEDNRLQGGAYVTYMYLCTCMSYYPPLAIGRSLLLCTLF